MDNCTFLPAICIEEMSFRNKDHFTIRINDRLQLMLNAFDTVLYTQGSAS